MTALFYSSPRARFLDSNANPLAFGRVTFYFPGTTTLKEVYTDLGGTTPTTNPHLLDAEGYVRDGGVWLGEGYYDILLEESDGGGGFNTLWTIPNVLGETATPSGEVGDVTYIRTINDLINLPAGDYGAVYVFGYYEENDGGQGWFLWDGTATDTEDGGAVIAPLGSPASGRWFRNFEDDHISVAQWGACATSPSAVNSNLQACLDYADSVSAKHTTVVIPEGTLTINGSFNATGTNTTLIFKSGAAITADASATFSVLTANAIVEGGLNPIVLSAATLYWGPVSQADAYLEWWSASDLSALLRSAGMYLGNLVFTGTYSIGALTQTLSHGSWIIRENASLDFTGEGLGCSVASYEYPLNSTNCFKGFWWVLDIASRSLPINHFENALASSAAYGKFLTILTDTYTSPGKILWAGEQTYSTAPAFTPSSHIPLASEVMPGSLLSFDNACWIGEITNAPGEYIVSAASTAFPSIASDTIYLGWLGAMSLDSSTLQASLDAASTWANGVKWISGADTRYYVADTDAIALYDADVNFTYKLKDFIFDGTHASNPSTFSIRNDCELVNVNFDFTNVGEGSLTLGDATDFGTLRIPDVTWSQSYTKQTAISARYAQGDYSQVIWDAVNDLGCGSYSHCSITDVSSTNFYQELTAPNPISVTNCVFNRKAQFYANVDLTFQNNIVNSDTGAVSLVPSVGSTTPIAQRFLITNNSFNYTGGSPDTLAGVSVAGTYASDGHLSVRITDNIHSGFLFQGTHHLVQVSSTFGSVGDTFTLGTSASWAVLPFAEVSAGSPYPYTAKVFNRRTSSPADPYEYALENVTGGSSVFSATFTKVRGADTFTAITTFDVSVNDLDSNFI